MSETKHPERRTGQRWEYSLDGKFPAPIRTLTKMRNGVWEAIDENGREICFASEREFITLARMFRLHPLAAQPAETQPKEPRCPTCDRTAAQHTNPLAHKFGEPRKAQLAPQPAPAKPVCWHEKRGDGPCIGAVAVRTIGCLETRLMMCDGHMLSRENAITCQMESQTGTPYAGPTRLPRPKLAHIAGMHDDDLIGGAR